MAGALLQSYQGGEGVKALKLPTTSSDFFFYLHRKKRSVL